MIPLVRVTQVTKQFARTRAVDGVSFDIAPGETLGLVGESGSGKSTLGRVVVGLLPATSGESIVAGQNVGTLRGSARKALWRHAQMVFQDPYSSLNPKMTVRDELAEPLRNFAIARGAEADRLIRETIEACGLPASALPRYPREFSGGQRQRIGIARALIVRPNFFVADDLAVIRHVSDRVAVMYRGKLVETAPAATLYATPRHPYTQLLLRSVPVPDPRAEAERRRNVSGAEVTNAEATEGGCPFAARCPMARFPTCSEKAPALSVKANDHLVACHFA